MKALAEEWKKRDREREVLMKKKVITMLHLLKCQWELQGKQI